MAKRSDDKLYSIPETKDIAGIKKKEKAELESLLREASSLQQAVDRLADIKKRIIELAQGFPEGVRVGRQCAIVSWCNGRKMLNKELLIENGVTPKQIESSYKEGDGYWKCELPSISDE